MEEVLIVGGALIVPEWDVVLVEAARDGGFCCTDKEVAERRVCLVQVGS